MNRRKLILWPITALAVTFFATLGGGYFYATATSKVRFEDLERGFSLALRESWNSMAIEKPYFESIEPVAESDRIPFGYTIRNRGFDCYWIPSWRQPAWVAYRLTPVPIKQSGERETQFISDWRAYPWTDHDDFTKSGYDRGHLAPHYAISTRYPLSTESSFLLSNISPQSPDLNRFLWRDLELYIARDLGNHFPHVFVICGPVFDEDFDDPKPIGPIPVPDAFFMIVTAVSETGDVQQIAWVIPQTSYREKLSDHAKYIRTLDEVRAVTGFRF
jgi:endonuclease G